MANPEPPDPRRAVPRRVNPAGSDGAATRPANPGRHRQRPSPAAPAAPAAPPVAPPAPAAPSTNGQSPQARAQRPPGQPRPTRAAATPSDPAEPDQPAKPTASSTPPTPPTPTKPGKKPKRGRRRRPAFWRELPMLILVALVLTFLIQTFLAKVYVIPSGSMETTLHGCDGCNNDRVLVDKITYRFTDPTPGDVVVFRGPDGWRNEEFHVEQSDNWFVRGLQGLGSLIGLAPPDEKDFVKRVIAVGGQTVSCCDSQQRVLVDGKPLNEPYVHYATQPGPTPQIKFGPVKIPDGSIWVMGDARDNSADSRVPGHGPVPVDNVIGKARLIVLPFARFGGIPDPDPQAATQAFSGPTGPVPAPLALGLFGAVPLVIGRRARRDGRRERRWIR